MAYRTYRKRVYRKRGSARGKYVKTYHGVAVAKAAKQQVSHFDLVDGVTHLKYADNENIERVQVAGVYALNATPLGTNYNNRTGNTIRMISLQITISCRIKQEFPAQFPVGTFIRHWVVLDKNPDQRTVAPTWDEVWLTSGLEPLRNPDMMERFKILKTFDMAVTPGAPCAMPLIVRLKVPYETKFARGNTGTVTYPNSFEENALTLWRICSNEGLSGGGAAIQCSYSSRLRYIA